MSCLESILTLNNSDLPSALSQDIAFIIDKEEKGYLKKQEINEINQEFLVSSRIEKSHSRRRYIMTEIDTPPEEAFYVQLTHTWRESSSSYKYILRDEYADLLTILPISTLSKIYKQEFTKRHPKLPKFWAWLFVNIRLVNAESYISKRKKSVEISKNWFKYENTKI